ncbi:hypothetical protein ACIQOW_20155 [Kitasatospora sp. NPDC091335]|uniref:hypothetical protein n=1 Tax=Kitasatospora sp. NPDC091335 TaxID=3364085 RepID=UPI0037F3B3DF
MAAIDNNLFVFTTPKTRSSRNWVALSDRATDAIDHALNQADSGARYGRHTTPRNATRPITRPTHRTRPIHRNTSSTKRRDHTATTSRRNIKNASSAFR